MGEDCYNGGENKSVVILQRNISKRTLQNRKIRTNLYSLSRLKFVFQESTNSFTHIDR